MFLTILLSINKIIITISSFSQGNWSKKLFLSSLTHGDPNDKELIKLIILIKETLNNED